MVGGWFVRRCDHGCELRAQVTDERVDGFADMSRFASGVNMKSNVRRDDVKAEIR